MNERRFYVYEHVVSNSFELNEKLYVSDSIVYVGSGTDKRYKSKDRRSFEHKQCWDDLNKIIIKDNLTEEESRQLEQELLLSHLESGTLLNKSNKCRTVKRKHLSYKELSKFFNIDVSSPSCLSWKFDRTNGKNHTLVKTGQIAGSTINTGGYRVTTLSGVQYFVHKIVWVLYNKQDCLPEFLIDHKDGDSLNNNPLNLQIVNSRNNNCNKKQSSRNITGKTGVYLKNMKGSVFWTATWQDVSGNKKRKYFGVNKFGNDTAFELACKARDCTIQELINQGVKYTERHING